MSPSRKPDFRLFLVVYLTAVTGHRPERESISLLYVQWTIFASYEAGVHRAYIFPLTV